MAFFLGIFSLNIQICLVFLVSFLFLFNYVKKQSWRNLPPGPPCLPIVGSLPFLSSKDMRQSMKSLQRKYGDIFTVHMGCARVVVLGSFDAIKEALRTRGEEFGERPDMYIVNEINKRMGIMAPKREVWKEQKRFSLNVLRTFGMGKSLLEDKIHLEAHHFLQKLYSLDGKPLNPQLLFMSIAYNIIGTLVSGKRMDYDSKELKVQMDAWKIRMEMVARLNFTLLFFPFVRYTPWVFSKSAKIKEQMTIIQNKHLEWIEHHKEKLNPSEEPMDFIDAYLIMMEKERGNKESSFTELQLLHIIDDLYAAGTNTSSTILCWAIIFLLNYPEVLQRCQDEIDTIIDDNRLPSMRDKLKMPYMEATLLEIQRMADIVPFNVPHCPVEDADFRGFHIPKGTMIFTNLNSIFTDERYFPNPTQFDPERFLNDDCSVKRIEQMIPFSMGPRLCLGEGLARMQLFIILASLLQHFTPTLPEGHKLPRMTGTLHITNEPDQFEAIFVKRK